MVENSQRAMVDSLLHLVPVVLNVGILLVYYLLAGRFYRKRVPLIPILKPVLEVVLLKITLTQDHKYVSLCDLLKEGHPRHEVGLVNSYLHSFGYPNSSKSRAYFSLMIDMVFLLMSSGAIMFPDDLFL